MVMCPLSFGEMQPRDRRLPRSSRDSYPRVGSMMLGTWSRGGDYQPRGCRSTSTCVSCTPVLALVRTNVPTVLSGGRAEGHTAQSIAQYPP